MKRLEGARIFKVTFLSVNFLHAFWNLMCRFIQPTKKCWPSIYTPLVILLNCSNLSAVYVNK